MDIPLETRRFPNKLLYKHLLLVDPRIGEEYAAAVKEATEALNEAELALPVLYWLRASDRHFPRVLHGRKLSEVLALKAVELVQIPRIGVGRFITILNMVKEIPQRRASVSSAMSARLFEDKRERSQSYLWPYESQPIGRCCESLLNLSRTYWDKPIANFIDSPDGNRVGEVRRREVTKVLQACASRPIPPYLTMRFLHRNLAPVENWLQVALPQRNPPAAAEIQRMLLEPLLKQIEIDAGHELALLLRERLIESRKLEQIASDRRFTRENGRQLMLKAAHIMRVRWPEGRFLIESLWSRASGQHFLAESRLLRGILKEFFSVKVAVTRTEPARVQE
jgi:hypothetical protein